MANKKFWLGITSLMLLFGFVNVDLVYAQSTGGYGQFYFKNSVPMSSEYFGTDNYYYKDELVIEAVYIRKSGSENWGESYISSMIAYNTATAVTFPAGLYDVKVSIWERKLFTRDRDLRGQAATKRRTDHVSRNVLIRENYITEIDFNGGLLVLPHKKMEGF